MRTANYNHINIGKIGDISSKICLFFIIVYTTSLLKSSMCPLLRYLWVNYYMARAFLGVAIIYSVQVRCLAPPELLSFHRHLFV